MNHELLRAAYAAYNRRDADALLALVSENVNWPNGQARLHGKDELRAYWNKQWAKTHTTDEVVEFSDAPDGAVRVHIHQVVRALDGSVISMGQFKHIHQIAADLTI